MTTSEPSVPFHIESAGYNPEQEEIVRLEGYPCYHWLQTESGEGQITLDGQTVTLPPQHGILFLPNIPHSYKSTQEEWSTYYLTFEGPEVKSILTSLGLYQSAVFEWEEHSSFKNLLEGILTKVMAQDDLTGLDNSMDLYQFMVQLKKYGTVNEQPSIYRLVERMTPLLEWLDHQYDRPEIGVEEMAAIVRMSPRHLNSLFRKAFGYTPYHYLITLRIRKSKELLLNERHRSIKSIAEDIGFRDVSHYIATFRKWEGLTPELFRKLYSN